ncbi:uncharacterized protein [Haliotis cracherodii]|uniref:uncharacterized protein n=1 Tax=Haliotis cracherodii TaxID=6455 RepID=UPI0039ECB09C
MPRLHRRHRKWVGRLMNAFCVRHSRSEERLFLDPEQQLLIELQELRCLNKRCATPLDDWEQVLWLAGLATVAPRGASIPVLNVCLGFENSELRHLNKRIVYSSYSVSRWDKLLGEQVFAELACEEFQDEPVIDGLPATVWLQCVEPTLSILKSLSSLKHRKGNLTNKKDITDRPLDSGYSQHGDFQFGPLAVFAFPRRMVMRLEVRVGNLRHQSGSMAQMALNGLPQPRNNHRRHRNSQLYHVMQNGGIVDPQQVAQVNMEPSDLRVPHALVANDNEGNLNDNANYPYDLGPVAYAPDYLPDIEVVAQHLFLLDFEPPEDQPEFAPDVVEVDEPEMQSDSEESSQADLPPDNERVNPAGRLSDIEVVDLEEFPENVQPRSMSASPSRDRPRDHEDIRAVVDGVVADIVGVVADIAGEVHDREQPQDNQDDVRVAEDHVRGEAAGGGEVTAARAFPEGIFEPREEERLSKDLGRIILSDSDMSLENELCVDQPPYTYNHTFYHLERGTPLQPQLPKVRRLRQKLKVFLTSECGDLTGSVMGAEIMRRVAKDHYTRRRIMVILNKLSDQQEDELAVNISDIGDSVCVSVVDQLPPTFASKYTSQRTRRERIMERMRRTWNNIQSRFRRLRGRFTGRFYH